MKYRFYVYAYLRDDGTPYYIGKGKGKRAFATNHNVSPPKDKSRIVFLETNLTDIGSLAIERRMIQWYGRMDLNTGILRNMTDGGDGASGLRMTEETKIKMSKSSKGKPKTEEHKRKMCEAWKHRIYKPRTEEANRKHSESMKGKTPWNKGVTGYKLKNNKNLKPSDSSLEKFLK
jgi:hypothetical protein